MYGREFQESRSRIEAIVSDYVPCGRGTSRVESRRVWWPNSLRPFKIVSADCHYSYRAALPNKSLFLLWMIE